MDFHRQIIGQKGVLVRQLMEAHDVNISIPPSSEKCDVIKIMGVPGKIEGAQRALEEKVRQLEKDRQEKVGSWFLNSGHSVTLVRVLDLSSTWSSNQETVYRGEDLEMFVRLDRNCFQFVDFLVISILFLWFLSVIIRC